MYCGSRFAFSTAKTSWLCPHLVAPVIEPKFLNPKKIVCDSYSLTVVQPPVEVSAMRISLLRPFTFPTKFETSWITWDSESGFELFKVYFDNKLGDLKSELIQEQDSPTKKLKEDVSLKFKHEGNKIQHKFNEEIVLKIRSCFHCGRLCWSLVRMYSVTRLILDDPYCSSVCLTDFLLILGVGGNNIPADRRDTGDENVH
jgi:hypothetical protein